jgi:WD40 repeat protein
MSPTVSLAQSSAPPELVVQTGHTRRITALAFSSDGRWLASSGDDHMVRLWEVSTGLEPRALPDLPGGVLPEHVHNVAFSPDGRWVGSVIDSRVTVWDTATGTRLWTKQSDRQYDFHFYDVAFSPDSRWVAVARRRLIDEYLTNLSQ